MKKLMFAAVAALACTAFAEENGIASENIVGYQDTEMKVSQGYNFIIPTFVDVTAGTATYNLQDIKLIDAAGDVASDFIYGYDKDACLTGVDYYWGTVEGSFFVTLSQDGWYDDVWSDRLVENITLPLGTGLYLYLGTEGAKVRYSGQVMQEEYTSVALSAGYNMVGNCTPVELDLQDIKLVDAAGDVASDFIYGYDKDACLTGVDYYWGTVEGSFFVTLSQDGWYDDVWSDQLVTDVKLAAGEGFYLYVGTEGAKIQLPSPMPKAE